MFDIDPVVKVADDIVTVAVVDIDTEVDADDIVDLLELMLMQTTSLMRTMLMTSLTGLSDYRLNNSYLRI